MKLSERIRRDAEAMQQALEFRTSDATVVQWAADAAALEAEVEKLRRINSEAAVELARRKEKP